MTIRPSTHQDLDSYTQLLQQTYVSAYVNDSLGLTAECFSPEIFANQDTQDYLKSHLINSENQKTLLAFDQTWAPNEKQIVHIEVIAKEI